jgi:acetoacetyl-CoA synthetase
VLRAEKEPAFSHLVGLRTEGSGRPLFIVHGIFGNVLQLLGLAERLQADRPVYALQARGVDPRLEPHPTIAEMAAAYIDAIRALQPTGPYALAGYSFGGLIAFEMACRLRESGEQVDLLVLFETDVYHGNLLVSEWLSHQWSLVGRVLRKLKILPPGKWPPYLLSKVMMIWHRLFLRLESADAEDRSVEVPETMRARNRELYRIGVREFIAYRPRRFPGKITLLRIAEPRFDMCDPLPLWKRLADGVDVFTVAGTHGTIMEDRHVNSVALQLSRCLAGGESTTPWQDKTDPERARVVVSRSNDFGQPAT